MGLAVVVVDVPQALGIPAAKVASVVGAGLVLTVLTVVTAGLAAVAVVLTAAPQVLAARLPC